jgi:hypothetical protein
MERGAAIPYARNVVSEKIGMAAPIVQLVSHADSSLECAV